MPEGSLVVVGKRLPPAVRKGGDGARVERAPGGLVAPLEPAL
jgi:hypothetical protein